jgi:hypothetical protein
LDWEQFGRVCIRPSVAVPGKDTGNGLFVVVDFEPGDVISEYGGIITDYRTDTHLELQTHDAALPVPGYRHTIVLRGFQDPYMYGHHLFRRHPILTNVAQICNDSRDNLPSNIDKPRTNSERIVLSPAVIPLRVKRYTPRNARDPTSLCTTPQARMPRMFQVATRSIPQGYEIFSNYHKSYWDMFPYK